MLTRMEVITSYSGMSAFHWSLYLVTDFWWFAIGGIILAWITFICLLPFGCSPTGDNEWATTQE